MGVNLAYTRASVVLALLFVTLPFVVRAVQPVLLELDPEMEQAAESLGASRLTVFRRIVLPNLTPAIIAGRRARLRARRGRVRLARPDHGQPSRSRRRPRRCSSSPRSRATHPTGAAAVSVVLLVIALVVLLFFGWLSKRALRHEE